MRLLPFLVLFLLPPLLVYTLDKHPQAEPKTPEVVLAAEAGDLERLDRLLSRSGEADLRDACRWTPLMKAALNGHERIVQRLLQEGVDVNAEDKGGYTALMLAASNDHAHIVALLAEAGADINHRERTNGWTALSWAQRLGHDETVQLLKKLGAR